MKFVLLLTAFLSAHAAASRPESVAFFYGASPPVDQLALHDWVVIDANNTSDASWHELKTDTTVYCYLSVGETQGERSLRHRSLVVGDNPGWRSKIMDVSDPAWLDALLQEAQDLSHKGCDGLFLDTLDSYQSAFDKKDWPSAEQGLSRIVSALHEAAPQRPILINRGFEIWHQVQTLVEGMVVEGLYAGWDSAAGEYKVISTEERQWLEERLETVGQSGKPIIIIDYLPPLSTTSEQTALAEKIAAQGYIPWVTDVSLNHLGTSHFTHHPRQVALLYSGRHTDVAGHDAPNLLGPVLDYYGLNIRPYDLADGLPAPVKGEHGGLLIWLDEAPEGELASEQLWEDWLENAIAHGIPVAMLGAMPPMSNSIMAHLGIRAAPTAESTSADLVAHHPNYGSFEAPPPSQERVFTPLTNEQAANTSWITMTMNGEALSPVLTGPWGGYAQHPYLLQSGFGDQRRWRLDPFAFIEKALRIRGAPIPDATTENGCRILLSHVDGDGFPSRAELPGTPFSAEVLLEQVFKKIDLPHTVSIIEGEISATGLYPELAGDLEAIARRIFALPNVEIASHSYSHPFYWSRRDDVDVSDTLYGLGLPIPGYITDMRREIEGSIDYINHQLAPEGKRAKVFLWTGDAIPTAATVAIVNELGLANLNGGNTQIRSARRSLTNVSPQSRWTESGYQVFAPMMNENVYTNDWTGPFNGFSRVIETFDLTDRPRRLKPVSIYYHFYSGTKPQALRALLDVYGNALARPHTAMYISEYTARVQGHHSARIRRSNDGAWLVDRLGALRTLRTPLALGMPDLAASQNIAGWQPNDDGYYLHLTADNARLVFTDSSTVPRLMEANGFIDQWEPSEAYERIALRIHAYEPVQFAIDAQTSCRLVLADGSEIKPTAKGSAQYFSLSARDTGHTVLHCN